MNPFSAPRRHRPALRAGRIATALLVPALALAGCAGGGGVKTPAGSAKIGDEITFGTVAAPPSLNPATGDPAYGTTYAWAYDPLVVTQPDGTIAPGLATKWGYVGSGNTAFELTLREGAKFSDGTPVDAAAVKTYLDYQRNQKVGSIAALFTTVKSIEATGPLTVRVNFSIPTPSFTSYIAQGLCGGLIASPKAVANPSLLDKDTYGAGPYMLDETQTVASDHYTFVPNPNYWDKSRQHFKKLTVKVIPNASSMVQAMSAGQVQAALGDPTTLQAARSAGLEVIAPPQALGGLNLMDRAGTVSKPLGDVRVRQALNYAVDRKALAKALFGDESLALSQYALKGQPGYDESLDTRYPYDPAKAKALLAEAGYPDGFTLKVLTVPLAGLDKTITAIAGQLAQVGVKLEITTKTGVNDYVVDMLSGKYPAAAIGYGLSNMSTLYAGFVNPAGPFNAFKYSDKELDALYAQYSSAPEDQSAQAEKAINAYLVEQAWTVPVVGAPLSYYTVKGLSGLDATSQNSGVPWLTELKPSS